MRICVEQDIFPGYESSLITVYNGYTYYLIDTYAYICVYALCRLYPGFESSLLTVYNGYTYYHIDEDAYICVYAWCTHILMPTTLIWDITNI